MQKVYRSTMAEEKFIKYPNDLFVTDTQQVSSGIAFSERIGKTGETYQKNYVKITFVKHRASANSRILNKIQEIVYPILYLPIPPRLMYETIGASYSPEDIGVLGNIIYANIRESGQNAENIKKTLQETVNKSKGTEVAKAFVTSAVLRTDAAPIRAGAFAEGVAYNPHTRVFYQGDSQNYRFFIFAWNLYPKNKEEAKNIKKIEKVFLKNALPSTTDPGKKATVNYNNHYKYPSNMLLEIYVDNKPFNKFKLLPSVITKVDISHNDVTNQNEMTFFEEDGEKFYVSTSIGLTLQETKVFTRGDVDRVHNISTN